MLFSFLERFLTANIAFNGAVEYRRVLLINAILSFAAIIFLSFGFYNLAIGAYLIAAADFVAAALVLAAVIDLHLHKNVTRAADVGIWGLFLFFLFFVYVNEGREFGLVWTIFFPIFVFLVRSKSGLGYVVAFYAVLFAMAWLNIGIWQEGQWSMAGFIRLVVASVLLSYVAYVSERAKTRADEKNDALLAREKAYSAQLREYQAELEERVSQTLSDLSDREKIILRNAQMAEMGGLIGVIAHQLKQPLSVLALLEDELQEIYASGELDTDFMRKHGKEFDKQIDHMSETVDDFRNFFNPNKQKRSFPLSSAVHKSLDLLRSQLTQEQIALHLDLDETIHLHGSESELQQVLINLLHNAKDALIAKAIAQPQVSISTALEPEKNRVVLTLEDNAGGIPETIIDRVFDFYFTTKADEGTGIGLYLVRKILQGSFGGDAVVENGPKGARFKLLFPVGSNET
jgi:signal transduction histidine kinase